MIKVEQKAIVLDLDNTLYNWTDAFVAGMRAQVDYLCQNVGYKESTILKYFHGVFTNYGSVEVPNAVQELGFWNKIKISEMERKKIQKEAWDIFLDVFKSNLCLYVGVEDTLTWAKEKGIYIFGFSDSFAYWTDWRLHTLEISQYFDKVFTRNNGRIDSCQKEELLYCADIVVSLELNELKPNITVIEKIRNQYGLLKSNIYMIGDSLEKDIFTAQASGVQDIWAKYGVRCKAGNGRYLGSITPWTKQDREMRLQAKKNIRPSFCIQDIEEIKGIIL